MRGLSEKLAVSDHARYRASDLRPDADGIPQRLLAKIVALHRRKHRLRRRFACGYERLHAADGKAEVHTHAGSIPGNQYASPTSSGCIFISRLGYSSVCGIFRNATGDPAALTAGCCLKSSSICGTDFSRLSDDEDRRPARGKGLFIRMQEATAHQTIGWRYGKTDRQHLRCL